MKRFTFILFFFLLYSCANEVSPSGGPTDTQAPQINETIPKNESVLFSDKKIILIFDEFIKLKSSSDNIYITPTLNEKPNYIVSGKTITIVFQEELLENTTYSIHFNNAIEDYNESNLLQNYNYVFSTGPFLDSLSLEGTVYDSFDKNSINNIYVLLYPATEDSILYKKPKYFARTNQDGSYSLNHLKEGVYKIACLEDKNLNLIFDQNNERIAFREEIITLSENIINDPLFLFQDLNQNEIINSEIVSENHLKFDFEFPFTQLNLDISNYEDGDIVYYDLNKKSLHYWFQEKDTTSFFYFNLNQNLDSIQINTQENYFTDSLFSLNIDFYNINNENFVEIKAPFPIKTIDKSLIKISDTQNNNIDFTTQLDKNNISLNLITQANLDTLILKIDKKAILSFNSINNNSLQKKLYPFSNTKSNLIFNFEKTNLDLVFELYNDNKELIAVKNVSRETKVSFNNLNSNQYSLRVYIDKNQDGIWNSGMFHVKQQPEQTILYIPSIDIKTNWDKELDISFQ